MKKENDVSPRCKISTETKTETISSRYFNPLGKSNFWQASQDFDPPFFFFQRFGAAPSSSMLVHAHNRKIPCSFFLLLPLGSIPVQSLPVREIYCDFYKSEKPRKFLPPARRNILSRSRNWKECNAQFEIFYRNYSCWSNDLKRERDIFFILFFHFWLKN